MRKSVTLVFVVFFLFVLSSCGGGGGGGDVPGDQDGGGIILDGEGTSSSPVDLGTIGQPITHAGSIGSFGYSYYKFRTDSVGGKYRFSMTNTSSELKLTVYSSSAWSDQVVSCDNIWSSGEDIVCLSSYPSDLAPNTDYYLKVSEWDFADDTYTLGISRVDSEGTTTNPALLVVGTTHKEASTRQAQAITSSWRRHQESTGYPPRLLQAWAAIGSAFRSLHRTSRPRTC